MQNSYYKHTLIQKLKIIPIITLTRFAKTNVIPDKYMQKQKLRVNFREEKKTPLYFHTSLNLVPNPYTL